MTKEEFIEKWTVEFSLDDDILDFISDLDAVILAATDKKSSSYSKETEDAADTIIRTWNGLLESKVSLTKQVKSKVNARLLSFKLEDILKSITNRANHVKNNPWYNTKANRHIKTDIMYVIKDDYVLDKWLNLEEEEVRKISTEKKPDQHILE